LKLHGVTFVDVLDLYSRRETTAMKEHIFAAIVRLDEAETFIPHDFLDYTRHNVTSPLRSAQQLLDNSFTTF
jgi:hypothetical protein